jgi:hypothetical protein
VQTVLASPPTFETHVIFRSDRCSTSNRSQQCAARPQLVTTPNGVEKGAVCPSTQLAIVLAVEMEPTHKFESSTVLKKNQLILV